MKHRCPVCKKVVRGTIHNKSKQGMYLPFCSKRCKYVDLGAWLDSEYRLICEAAPDQDNSTDTPWEKSSDEQ